MVQCKPYRWKIYLPIYPPLRPPPGEAGVLPHEHPHPAPVHLPLQGERAVGVLLASISRSDALSKLLGHSIMCSYRSGQEYMMTLRCHRQFLKQSTKLLTFRFSWSLDSSPKLLIYMVQRTKRQPRLLIVSLGACLDPLISS